jgi:hypothetical protein
MPHEGTIDVVAVRLALTNLERLAVEHPELLGESDIEGWVEVLREIEEADDMGKTIQVGVRFPEEVVELIDSFATETTAELRANLPGLEVNRAGAIRILVEKALRDEGYEVPTEAPKKRARKKRSK